MIKSTEELALLLINWETFANYFSEPCFCLDKIKRVKLDWPYFVKIGYNICEMPN